MKSKNEDISFTQKEIEILYEKLNNQDKSAREKIIEKTYGLVYYCAKKYRNKGIDFEELVSIGEVSLVKAVDTYNPCYKNKFITYAISCIVNSFLNVIRKQNKMLEKNAISTNVTIVDDESRTIEDTILSADNIEEDYCDQMQIRDLKRLVYNLPERERFIIMNYYGIDSLDKMELKQIAKIIGYSPSNTSRKMSKTHKILKEELSKLGYTSETYARTRR